MISCTTEDRTLIVTKDDEDDPRLAELVADIANSAAIDFVKLANEGAPVNLGNDYAEYVVLIDTHPDTVAFGIGPKELWALKAYDRVMIRGYDSWQDE